MSNNLRSSIIRLASTNPELRPHLMPLLKEAAYPREGRARVRLLPSGFQVFYSQSFSPVGLAAEKVGVQGDKTRESMKKFVERLSEGLGITLSLTGESAYVLLGVEGGSITFNVDGTVKLVGRKPLTREMIESAEDIVFDRFGYQVEFL